MDIHEPRWKLAGGDGREFDPMTGDRAAFVCLSPGLESMTQSLVDQLINARNCYSLPEWGVGHNAPGFSHGDVEPHQGEALKPALKRCAD